MAAFAVCQQLNFPLTAASDHDIVRTYQLLESDELALGTPYVNHFHSSRLVRSLPRSTQ